MFLLNQGRSILKKELASFINEDAAVCFAIILASLVKFVSRNMIFFSSQAQFFSKELAIAKPAKYI